MNMGIEELFLLFVPIALIIFQIIRSINKSINKKRKNVVTTSYPAPPVYAGTRECPYCAKTVPKTAAFCEFCGGNIGEYKKPQKQSIKKAVETVRTIPLTATGVNQNMAQIIKRIIAEYGESILSEPKRVSAFFADLAKDEPKPQKQAFIKCLEHGFAETLKNAAEADKAECKQSLAQRLHDEEGLDIALCVSTLDLLAALVTGTGR